MSRWPAVSSVVRYTHTCTDWEGIKERDILVGLCHDVCLLFARNNTAKDTGARGIRALVR